MKRGCWAWQCRPLSSLPCSEAYRHSANTFVASFALYRAEQEDIAAVAYACEMVEAGETVRDFPIGADAAAKTKSTEAGAHAIAGLEQRSMKAVVVSFSSAAPGGLHLTWLSCTSCSKWTYCQLDDCIAQQLSAGSQHVGSPLQRHIINALLPRALVDPDAEDAGPPDTVVAPLRATLMSAALAKGAALLTMHTVTSLNLLLPSRQWERSVRMPGPTNCCS